MAVRQVSTHTMDAAAICTLGQASTPQWLDNQRLVFASGSGLVVEDVESGAQVQARSYSTFTNFKLACLDQQHIRCCNTLTHRRTCGEQLTSSWAALVVAPSSLRHVQLHSWWLLRRMARTPLFASHPLWTWM